MRCPGIPVLTRRKLNQEIWNQESSCIEFRKCAILMHLVTLSAINDLMCYKIKVLDEI